MIHSTLSGNEIIEDGGCLLYQAILEGDVKGVNEILSSELCPKWSDIRPQHGALCNILVAALGSPDIVSAILKKYSADICFKRIAVEAFSNAARNGHHKSVALLFEQCGTDIHSDFKGSALEDAAGNGHHETVTLLLEQCGTDIKPGDKGWALKTSASNGHHETVALLLEQCGDVIRKYEKRSALEDAASNGHHETVRVLLEKCGADIHSDFKSMALNDAARNGHHETVALLLEQCGDLISAYGKGMALTSAVSNGHHETVALLLEQCGADIEPRYKGCALDGAASNGHHEIVTLLLEQWGADIHLDFKRMALDDAARNGHHKTVALLLEQWGDIINTDNKGNALGLAAEEGHHETVALLLEQCGADIHSDFKGMALEDAASNGHHETVRVLLEQCGDVIDADNKSEALGMAARNGHHETVALLLEQCGTDIEPRYKGRALDGAASNGHYKTVVLLLGLCGDVIKPIYKGLALEDAAGNGHHETVALLLEQCDDVINADNKGWALNNAASNGHHETVALLLKQCGDVINADSKPLALKNALSNGHHEIVAFLLERCLLIENQTLKECGFEYATNNELYQALIKNDYCLEIIKKLHTSGFRSTTHPFVYDECVKRLNSQPFDHYGLINLVHDLCHYADNNPIHSADEEIQKIIADHSSIDKDLPQGPIIKSKCTKKIETILEKIGDLDVSSFNDLAESMIRYEEGHYIIRIPGSEQEDNLSFLINHANLSHINLSDDLINKIGKKLEALHLESHRIETNPIIERLPQAQQKAVSIYITKKYRNINKLFRAEAMDLSSSRMLLPTEGGNNLVCFLLGCLLNDLAVKSTCILHQLIHELKVQRYYVPLSFTEATMLTNLENLLTISTYDRGEFLTDDIKQQRISNPTALPALTSISARADGSPHFHDSESTRTVLSNNPYQAIIRDDWAGLNDEAEILIPQGECWITTHEKDGHLVSTFIRSPVLEQKNHYASMMALMYAHKNYLSKEYKEEPSSIELNSKIVNRPNHELSHTYRVMGNITLLVDYFKDHARDEEFKNFCTFITDKEIEYLRIATAFSITGRESEIAAREDLGRYDRYREASMNHVASYMAHNVSFDDVAKDRILDIVRWMGNPRYESEINLHPNLKERQLRNYYHRILTIAHKLDLPRCYGADEFIESMQKCRDLSVESTAQKQALNAIIKYDIELIKAHGSHLRCDMDLEGHLYDASQGYKAIFAEASSDIKKLESLTRAVTKPKRVIPMGPTDSCIDDIHQPVITQGSNRKRVIRTDDEANDTKCQRSLPSSGASSSSASSSSSSSSSYPSSSSYLSGSSSCSSDSFAASSAPYSVQDYNDEEQSTNRLRTRRSLS